MVRLSLVVALVAFAGCKTENPDYCPNNPGMQGCADDGGSQACKLDTDCKNSTLPVCNTDIGVCTQCFSKNTHNSCPDTSPRCEIDTCVACVDDGDCESTSACLPSGACANSATVIHVVSAGGSDLPSCGASGPGNACTLTRALAIVTATKNVIKFDDSGVYAPDTNNFLVVMSVTIDARTGAILHRIKDGPILALMPGANATILGGKLQGTNQAPPHGDGLRCDSSSTLNLDKTSIEANSGSGIIANNCTVIAKNIHVTGNAVRGIDFQKPDMPRAVSITLSQSLISLNGNGGLNVDQGSFKIIGNAFFDNGDAMVTQMPSNNPNAAVTISTAFDATNIFDFNTIAHNNSQNGVIAGVDCKAGSGFIGRNNIIWNNFGNTTAQITGNCMYSYSFIQQASLTGNDAGHNMNLDPQLMSNPILASSSSDPHLKATSPAIGYADPAANLIGLAAQDIDGNTRSVRTGMGADIGADQYKQ